MAVITKEFDDGNWGTVRSIRRTKPWNLSRLRESVSFGVHPLRTGVGVDIYSIDSSIRVSHDEFDGRATLVFDGVVGTLTTDGFGHGTATASVAAGATMGLATGAEVFSFRCLDNDGLGSGSNVLIALGAALDHYQSRDGTDRPAVVIVALGNIGSVNNDKIIEMIEAGMFVCAAAGNGNIDLDTVENFPADTPGVLCVGGSNPNDGPYFFNGDDGTYYATAIGTNYGSPVDILAPSSSVRTAAITGDSDYRTFSGTSFGCAMAAGVVACMLEGHGRLRSAAEVADLRAKVMANATPAFVEGPTPNGRLPNRILYLDPTLTIEDIAITEGATEGTTEMPTETPTEGSTETPTSTEEPTESGGTDPYFANVKLLMHFDGADAQTTTVDSSADGRTVTGGGTLATAQSEYGPSSSDHGNTYLKYWEVPSGGDLSFDMADSFTAEVSVYLTSAAPFSLMGIWGTLTECNWYFFAETYGKLGFVYYDTGLTFRAIETSSYSPTLNAWHKLAYDYDGTDLRLYADGVMIAKGALAGTIRNPLTNNLHIGHIQGVTTYGVPGYLDELRITKGVARYASDLGYTPATGPFPNS